MSNIEILVSPQDLIVSGSIYSRQKSIEESFPVDVEANVCVQQFLRYLPISIQHWLTDILVSTDRFDTFWALFERSS